MLLGRRWGHVAPFRVAAKPSSTRLALCCRVACAQQQAVASLSPEVKSKVALQPLIGGVRAHESSLSCAIVVQDEKDGTKVLVTASLDKTIAAWRLVPNEEDAGVAQPFYCEVQKIATPGGPVFSIAPSRPLFDQPTLKPTSDGKASVTTIFCGNAAKEVVSWQPFMPSFNPLKMDGHTGWVRSVATYDKYLFSCGCNYLRQWDCTYATPKEINKVKLFTGDILVIAAGKGFVYTGGADGSLRSWSVDKGTGALTEVAVKEHAHDGRISAVVRHEGFVYSCGADGSIKMWKQGTLELVAEVNQAHGDSKVHCAAIAGNGVMYTGGDDMCIRAWDPSTLQPLLDFEPLQVHSSAVRTLAAGKSELLVSGDSEGYVNFLRVPPGPEPKPLPDVLDIYSPVPDALSPPPVDSTAPLCSMDALPVEPMVQMTEHEFTASLSPQPSQDDESASENAATHICGAAASMEGHALFSATAGSLDAASAWDMADPSSEGSDDAVDEGLLAQHDSMTAAAATAATITTLAAEAGAQVLEHAAAVSTLGADPSILDFGTAALSHAVAHDEPTIAPAMAAVADTAVAVLSAVNQFEAVATVAAISAGAVAAAGVAPALSLPDHEELIIAAATMSMERSGNLTESESEDEAAENAAAATAVRAYREVWTHVRPTDSPSADTPSSEAELAVGSTDADAHV